MRKIVLYKIVIFSIATCWLASCSITRSVPDGDALYTGASVEIADKTATKKKGKGSNQN